MFDPAFGAGSWQERFKSNPETVLVLYSGNLGRKQGLETIVDAARLLQANKDIHFIVSGDGAGREDMMKHAEGLNNITFIPLQPMEDFRHLMIAADIHLLPQKAGAADLVMPSKLGNILASGRPVVTGAAPGTQVLDAIQKCGIAVEPENSQAFAEAIRTLAMDKALRLEMGKHSIERAKTDWSKQGILHKMEALLSGNKP